MAGWAFLDGNWTVSVCFVSAHSFTPASYIITFSFVRGLWRHSDLFTGLIKSGARVLPKR